MRSIAIEKVFDVAFGDVVGIEGQYSNDSNDSGGETMWGITVDVARENGYAGPMAEMPLDDAKRIYRLRYWDKLSLDDVAALDKPIAMEMFECGVNCGPEVAAEFLQRALNALNREQKDYPDVAVDGSVGSKTVACLGTLLNRRAPHGEIVTLRALNCLQGARYIRLAEQRSKDERFLFGWLMNRIRIA